MGRLGGVRAGSTISIDGGRFLRKPDFQLLDVGRFAPAASFSRNIPSSNSRHPEISDAADVPASAERFNSIGRAGGGGSADTFGVAAPAGTSVGGR
jgi:hypothetical protein